MTVTIAGDEVHDRLRRLVRRRARPGINVVLNYTHAYASFAIKAAMNPEVPHNEGAFRPGHVRPRRSARS